MGMESQTSNSQTRTGTAFVEGLFDLVYDSA
jgi:hypothetical protein